MTEKVQAQTLEDVNIQLDKFRKRIDLNPLLKAMDTLETALNQKIDGVTGDLSEEILIL